MSYLLYFENNIFIFLSEILKPNQQIGVKVHFFILKWQPIR